jgi:hypothetical protein
MQIKFAVRLPNTYWLLIRYMRGRAGHDMSNLLMLANIRITDNN